jgi:hypothetical protein
MAFKENWLTWEFNANDFMIGQFERLFDGDPNLERKLAVVAAIGADRDEYGIPGFQRWFFEEHNEEWKETVATIRRLIDEYVDMKLETVSKAVA